jgi:hypothetical protein
MLLTSNNLAKIRNPGIRIEVGTDPKIEVGTEARIDGAIRYAKLQPSLTVTTLRRIPAFTRTNFAGFSAYEATTSPSG